MNKKTSITKDSLIETLDHLSEDRPVFHSEVDFQLALARKIEEEYDCQVRLEYPVYIPCLPWERHHAAKDEKIEEPTIKDDIKSNYMWSEDDELRIRRYLDILVLMNGKAYPIELKYKTANLTYLDKSSNDYYNLVTVGAQNLGSYDFWKDVYRIEQMASVIKGFERGFTVWLTNDSTYESRDNKDSQYYDFAVYEGKKAESPLNWKIRKDNAYVYVDEDNPDDSKKSRQDALTLHGSYTIHWQCYGYTRILNDLKAEGNITFRFAVNEISL